MPANAVSSSVRFDYRCLGPALLTRADGSRVSLRTRKQAALLYYLARQVSAPASRDQLTELFWPEGGGRRARHSLAQATCLINKALGYELVAAAGRERVFVSDGLVRLDVTEFERHAEHGSWEEARSLWRGPLLDGLWVKRAPSFERWLADERDRLARVFRGVLRQLIEARREGGDWTGMRATAEELLGVDPLDEGAMLAYLESLTLLDDRTLALRRYAEFEQRIREELAAEPGAQLRAWAARHRRGDSVDVVKAVAVVSRVSEMQVLPAVRPLFGRDEEFALLWEGWEGTKRGTGCFVILEGEAGIGKTALAAKLANQVHVAGGSVCFVKCYRTEKAVPFAPITALIRQLSRLPGFVAMDPVWIGELTRLVPELKERYPSAPAPMAIDDSARHRLCDATVNAAEAVAGEQPLLLVVDDVQDADEASLALIHYLGRQATAMPVTLICSSRTGVYTADHERTFFETARSGEFARFVSLAPLPDGEIVRIAQLVLAQRGVDAREAILLRIQTTARGNPLHAIEASLSATAEYDLHGDQRLRGPAFEVSSSERFEDLSEHARFAAGALAVAGRPLSEYQLAVVTELPPGELSAAITSLETEHFVKRMGGKLCFVHDRYVPTVEALVGGHTGNELHVRLANYLLSSAGGNPSAHYEVANHLLMAGRLDEALLQARSAATFAASLGAIRSKAQALELALDVSPVLDLDCAVELGNCYLLLNDTAALMSLENRVRPQGTRAESDFDYFATAAAFQSGQLTCPDAVKALNNLVRRGGGGFRHRADACLLLMRTADKTRDYATVRSVARELRRGGQSAHSMLATGYLFSKYYSPHRALPLLQKAMSTARAENQLHLEQQCREGIGIVLKQMGRFRDSIRELAICIGLARKTMNPQAEVAALHNRAVTEMALGDFDAVQKTHEEAARLGEPFNEWIFNYFRIYNDALTSLYRSKATQARDQFLSVRDACARAGLDTLARQAAGGAAVASIRLGDCDGLGVHASFIRVTAQPSDASTCSWLDVVALAWDEAVNRNHFQAAIRVVQEHARQLSRRDVAQWLALELEIINVVEFCTGRHAVGERRRLHELATRFESRAVARETHVT